MATAAGDPGSIYQPRLPFQLPPGFQPADFLYGEQGPWPCVLYPEQGQDPAKQCFAAGVQF
jgi:hypothetical protein